ncbi:TPA: DUF4303 domain-containing protein [Salmonella enterica subsp. enterica serovar Grumpensis]
MANLVPDCGGVVDGRKIHIMRNEMFNSFDLKGFWKDNAESKKDFISQDTSAEIIQQCEEQLGFKLPDSYITLMKGHNGGILGRDVFQKKDANGKIIKSVICEFLNAIGGEKHFSLMSDWSKWIRKGYNSGILIGLHMPDSGYGKQYYLDYSLCGPQGEPRVICHTRIWRDNTTQEIDFELAETFESFVKGLVKKPKIAPFNFFDFNARLKNIIKEIFTGTIKKHIDENINSFGLYTAEEASFIATAFNTKEYFETLSKNSNEKEFYKYSTANWKYQGTEDGHCNKIFIISEQLEEYSALLLTDASLRNFRNKLIDNCALVLEELKQENFFKDHCKDTVTLMVNLTQDDLPKAKYKKLIYQLN